VKLIRVSGGKREITLLDSLLLSSNTHFWMHLLYAFHVPRLHPFLQSFFRYSILDLSPPLCPTEKKKKKKKKKEKKEKKRKRKKRKKQFFLLQCTSKELQLGNKIYYKNG
jgi:hypothetical protein